MIDLLKTIMTRQCIAKRGKQDQVGLIEVNNKIKEYNQKTK